MSTNAAVLHPHQSGDLYPCIHTSIITMQSVRPLFLRSSNGGAVVAARRRRSAMMTIRSRALSSSSSGGGGRPPMPRVLPDAAFAARRPPPKVTPSAAGTGHGAGTTTGFAERRTPVSWTSLFLAAVTAASAVAYYRVERERRLEEAMGRIVSSESNTNSTNNNNNGGGGGWTPKPDLLAPRRFVPTAGGLWMPADDGWGAREFCLVFCLLLFVVFRIIVRQGIPLFFDGACRSKIINFSLTITLTLPVCS